MTPRFGQVSPRFITPQNAAVLCRAAKVVFQIPKRLENVRNGVFDTAGHPETYCRVRLMSKRRPLPRGSIRCSQLATPDRISEIRELSCRSAGETRNPPIRVSFGPFRQFYLALHHATDRRHVIGLERKNNIPTMLRRTNHANGGCDLDHGVTLYPARRSRPNCANNGRSGGLTQIGVRYFR